MSFLYCNPSVFVINDYYEILVLTKENGIITINIADEEFYEDNCGVLASEKNYAKIKVNKELLDSQKSYTVNFRKSINRRAYFSEIGDVESESFSFKPLVKTNNINMYHIADVHYKFDIAKKTVDYFKDDLDLYIVNGDIGEVETLENYYDVINFIGEIAKGYIPILFVRGNHDTRGKLAELYPNFFPANNKDTFYSVKINNLNIIALDCGEDKPDTNIEYGGVNNFKDFRRRETKFLQKLILDNDFTFAVSHICPSHTTKNIGNCFDIERDTYMLWNKELNRLNVKFMITAHMHKTYIINKTDERSTIPHDYPVIVGSGRYEDDIWGAALTIKDNEVIVKFTDSNNIVREETVLKF